MPLEIREAHLSDATAIARLMLELGCDDDESAMRRHLDRVLRSNQNIVFVAEEAPHGLLGVVHAQIVLSLAHAPRCAVESLVVTTDHRENGIGRALLERVHGWSLRRGVDEVHLATARSRKAAHRFLGKLGYTMLEEQRLFVRDLAHPSGPDDPTTGD